MYYIRNMSVIQTIKNMTIKNDKHLIRKYYHPSHDTHLLDLEDSENDFVKYRVSPSCVTCIHFLNDSPENVAVGKCKLFGEKNLVTGKINYQFAEICRIKNNMCMSDGLYYKKNPHDKLNYKIEKE